MGRRKKVVDENVNISENVEVTEKKEIKKRVSAYNEKKASPEKEIYLKEILPLLLKIKNICIKNKFPMFFTTCIHPDGGTNGYETETVTDFVSPFSVQQKLTPDYIAECIKVINGYVTYLPEENENLDMEVDETDEE